MTSIYPFDRGFNSFVCYTFLLLHVLFEACKQIPPCLAALILNVSKAYLNAIGDGLFRFGFSGVRRFDPSVLNPSFRFCSPSYHPPKKEYAKYGRIK